MALPIQNVAGLLRFPGESAGGVTIGAQNIGGQLIILLPNTDPVVDQVLAVDSVSGTSVITKWATPESSGPESNETWLEEFGGGVSVNAGPTIPTGQAAEFYMFDNVGATLEAKLASGTVSIVTNDSDSGSISLTTADGLTQLELMDSPAPSNRINLSPNGGSGFEAKNPAGVPGVKAALEAAMAPMQAARKAYTDFLKTAAGATTPARLQLSDDGKSIIVG